MASMVFFVFSQADSVWIFKIFTALGYEISIGNCLQINGHKETESKNITITTQGISYKGTGNWSTALNRLLKHNQRIFVFLFYKVIIGYNISSR